MRPYQPNFIDKSDRNGPFEGALVVMNIGRENYDRLSLFNTPYEQSLRDVISNAMARGMAIIHAWDKDKGISLPPLGFEDHEEMVFPRLLVDVCGIENADFELTPSKRTETFERMMDHLLSHKDFFFTVPYMGFVGLCRLDGTEVFMPPNWHPFA